MNGYFVGVVIYADNISLLSPTKCLWCICQKHRYFIKSGENQLYIFPAHPNSLPGLPLHFMNIYIVCDLLVHS